MKSKLTRTVIFVAVAAALVTVAGCGNKGPLVPPKALVSSTSNTLLTVR